MRSNQAMRADQGQALLLVVHDSARCIYVYRHGRVAAPVVIGLRAATRILAYPRVANSPSIMVRHNACECQNMISNSGVIAAKVVAAADAYAANAATLSSRA